MAGGFKVWNLIENDFVGHNPHVPAAVISAAALIGISFLYRRKAAADVATAADLELVPSPKPGLLNFVELFAESVQGIAKDVIGPRYREFLPLLLFIFFFILVSNLLGSIPGLGSATDNLNMTLAVSSLVFLYYNYVGIKENGAHYIEHYTGHLKGLVMLATLGPLLFVIELMSHGVRPLTLAIRLRTNIFADHTVFGVFSKLAQGLIEPLKAAMGTFGEYLGIAIASMIPIPIIILGLLVSVIQAVVFTLLTMIYLGMVMPHEEHHH